MYLLNNFQTFIILVSILLFMINNLVVIDGQIINDNNNNVNHPYSSSNIDNRPRFKNGTLFHFGGHHHHSSNVIKTRPITGSVIHVSDTINVDNLNNNNANRINSGENINNDGHFREKNLNIDHTLSHHHLNSHYLNQNLHRPQNHRIHFNNFEEGGRSYDLNQFNRSAANVNVNDDHHHRLITSAHQGGRTDLESYHRAAVIPDDHVSTIVVSSNNGNNVHHHSTGGGGGNIFRGTIVDVTDSFAERRRPSNNNNDYGRLQTHHHHSTIPHHHHVNYVDHGLQQNRSQIGAFDRNNVVVVHSGAPYTINTGHLNRIQSATGVMNNRTGIAAHNGIGSNIIYTTGGHHNRTGFNNATLYDNVLLHHSGHPYVNRTAAANINSGSTNIYSNVDHYINNQTHGSILSHQINPNINRINNNQPSSISSNTNNEYINKQAINNKPSTSSSASSTTQSGTSSIVSLNTIDNVDVEAINKARIYAEHENEEKAKKHAQNVVRLAATDQLESEIITNRTRAYLSCESGEMIVKINFTEPFRGVGYADYDRTSPCKFYGDGGKYYEMRLPLKGCGTKQEAPRIFINNIILRFHRALELEEDEIKTIVCRYPPPLAPPPPLIAAPILEQPPPAAPFLPAKLSEVELLLIVSALLFLTLLLLGIGIGYYCLKKRKVKVVRKFVPPAEIPYFPPPSISSEEHSIISEGSVIHRDDYQFQNIGYIPEAKLSYLDDTMYHDQDLIDDDIVQQQQNVFVPPVPLFSTKKFDDRFVTNASETDIDTDYEVDRLIVPKKPKITKLVTDKYFVTPKTTTEIIDEITTHRVIVPPKKPITTKYLDDTMITPHSDLEIDEITTNQRIFGPKKPIPTTQQTIDDTYIHSEQETDIVDDVDKYRIHRPPQQPKEIKNIDDHYQTNIYEINEVIDDFDQTLINAMKQTSSTTNIKTDDDEYITHSRDIEEFVDNDRIVKNKPVEPKPPERKPKITVKNIDDFYVTNITETETNEQITKIGRSMPNLTMEMIDYEEEETIDEEKERLLEQITGFDVKLRSIPRNLPKTTTTTTTTTSDTTTTTTTITKIDEVLRILNNPPRDKIPDLDEHFMLPTRNRFKQIILTDETFRTIIIESTTIEEYVERIQHHPKYGPMFEPPTWEVIFRILSLPEISQIRPKKPTTTTTRYSDTYRSGFSAVRSVTEEDVIFSRKRSSQHFVPLPDYPMDDDDDDLESLKSSIDWNKKRLPDPKRYECHSPDFQPIKSAFPNRFGIDRRSSKRSGGTISPISSSVFGTRRLENPYTTNNSKLFYDYYDLRPYSPDLDALSLEPSQSYLAYSGSIRRKQQQQQLQTMEEREEIKSTTETNVYDWKRYS